EKGAGRNAGAILALQRMVIGETIDASVPLPVTIRGEDAGRQVRGGASGKADDTAKKGQWIRVGTFPYFGSAVTGS
ncbi:hypothetical protein, partial [Mesorhizobium sp. M7A.F.Ca.CA.004.09.1.2]